MLNHRQPLIDPDMPRATKLRPASDGVTMTGPGVRSELIASYGRETVERAENLLGGTFNRRMWIMAHDPAYDHRDATAFFVVTAALRASREFDRTAGR